MSLAERYQDVARRVDGRARLVAVGKSHPVSALQELYALGQRDFGENRVDELRAKAQALPPDARWHFLGNLQRNKLKVLLETGALIHSFDRDELAPLLRDHPVLVQVDFGTGRNGVAPERIEETLLALSHAGVPAVGLMLLPPRGEDPQPHFRRLRALRDELLPRWPFLVELSMGMSEDFEAALEEGATMVRVGRAIFGERGA
ncbi:MAG: dependent protein [Thermoplasmata archaeon]|jgi:pyridoxal phosphate enzyme (YggS family)|nr:dependent protein [Thermoplasmata archaeon]